MPKSQVRGLARRNSLLAGILAVVIAAGGVWYALFGGGVAAKPDSRPQAPAVPVTVATVARQDVPLLMEGIGTVQPLNIVTIRSRVDGELQKVMFTEGQEVKAGDPLAQIDPRPFQAALDQAVAKKAQDEAKLANAQRDLERYQALARKDFSSRQQSDTQKAQVAQFQAMVKADQASIDNAAGPTRLCVHPLSHRRTDRLPAGRSGQYRPCRGCCRHRRRHPDCIRFPSSSPCRKARSMTWRKPWRGVP